MSKLYDFDPETIRAFTTRDRDDREPHNVYVSEAGYEKFKAQCQAEGLKVSWVYEYFHDWYVHMRTKPNKKKKKT